MAIFEIEKVEITGIACCVPENTIRTVDFPFSSEQDCRAFINGTGVEETRYAPEEVCASDLCYEAAERLIKDLNIDKEQIKIVVFVSQSPDYFLPATAIILQDRLGISKSCMAFDIGLGCSGYVYGLSVISGLLRNIPSGHALLLCGDKSTFSTHPKDKSTRPLFGDAGSATILTKREEASPMHFNLQSDGSGFESIIIRGGGTRNPYSLFSTEDREIEKDIWRNELSLEMDGVEVFNFSLREVKKNIFHLLDSLHVDKEEVDFFVMHQANKFLNETIRKKMGVGIDKVPYSIGRFGNTSSASIPLTLVTELAEKLQSEQLNLLLCGFGVGYSWGSVYLHTSNVKVYPLIELK
ncbi:MAG: ketoacyl-ACP synthase III [Flavobacteriia bacterium]|nr:ketoacyl-ACP synthase III [Flavobacteriia bacterium]OJX35012.1 MAG: hypothetical protein BGO87_09765 [Flavobacteriia bacterium 40-80]